MKKLKAVLFDLDGTLLDSLRDLADSMNAVLEQHGHPIHPVNSYKYMVGDGMPALVKRALPENKKNTPDIEKYIEMMKEEYSNRWGVFTKPYPGIVDLLTKLQGMGIPKTIFSNKPDDFTQLTVDKILKDFSFKMVLGLKDDVPRKPDPHGALLISKSLGIPVNEFLYVGDTGTDMKTASAAGMFPVGVLWGFRDREELMETGAASTIQKPEEILKYF